MHASFSRLYKTLRYALLLPTLLIATTGCERFLDPTPTDRLIDDPVDAYNNPNALFLHTLAPIYSRLGGNTKNEGLQGSGRDIYDFNTFCTDEAIMPTRGADWYDGGFWQDLYLHDFGGIDGIGDVWNYIFRQILACNSAIEHINRYTATHPNDNLGTLLPEARALRAMMMFYALDIFGRIPVFVDSQPTAESLALQPRSTTFLHIVDELLDVAPLLSPDHSNLPGPYYGRITQAPAYFLLAKLMLNAEIYADDDYTDNNLPDGKNIVFTIDNQSLNAWEATIYFCNRIEALGYRLEPDFTANFAVHNENSMENIFTIACDKYLYNNQFVNLFRSRHYNHAAALGLNGENGACATTDALRIFGLTQDGNSTNLDPRFHMTYYCGPVYDLNGNRVILDDGTPLSYLPWEVKLDVSGTDAEKTAGARMKKYEVDPDGLQDGKLSDNDIVLMRYADVLLMKAEASVRNGLDGSTPFNAVRARVGADTTMPCTLDNLLDERLRELAWEGWRRNDLIRFGRFTQPYAHRNANPTEQLTHYTIVYPIPGEVLSVANSEQNPGY